MAPQNERSNVSIERTELGIWLLVPEAAAPKRKRSKRATKSGVGQFTLADAIRRVMNKPELDWSV